MSPIPITIRNLGPEDAHILENVRPGLLDTELDLSRAWALLATRVNELVVALDRGEVVGIAYGTMLMRPDNPSVFLVNSVLVHEKLRRQGLGRRLLLRLTELAQDRGCDTLWTLTEGGDAVAEAFYRATNGTGARRAELREWAL